MPEQTRFDVDELFHTADVPDMSVDTPAVVTAGRKVRRRRQLAGAASLAAATVVAALAVSTATGVLGAGRSPDADPAGGTSASPGPDAPAIGTSVRLSPVELPSMTGDGVPAAARTLELDYGMADPDHPVLGVDPDEGTVSVLRVTQTAPNEGGTGTVVSFDDPAGAPERTTVSRVNDHVSLVIAPAGAAVSLDTAPDADLGGIVSDSVDLPGTQSSVWFFATARPAASADLRGAVVDHDARFLHVPADQQSGSAQELTTVSPGTDGDPARVYYSDELDLFGLDTGQGSSYSKRPSQSEGEGLPGGLASTDGEGEVAELWIFQLVPGAARSATIAGEDGRAIPLRLSPLTPGLQLGYAHETGTVVPTGDLSVTWTDSRGSTQTQPVR